MATTIIQSCSVQSNGLTTLTEILDLHLWGDDSSTGTKIIYIFEIGLWTFKLHVSCFFYIEVHLVCL